jgi:SWIM zinc finger
MSTPTFLDILRSEVARMQALRPDREGEIGRAAALIALGMVQPTDDPATAHVLSSDGLKHYTVNGRCSCQAGDHGRPCKHLAAWRLYQHVQKKMTPQAPASAAEPLPEARSSLNFKALISGFEVQLTLRDENEEALLGRLQTLLKRQDIRPVPKPAQKAGNWKARSYNGR